jgi:hypothetical protein
MLSSIPTGATTSPSTLYRRKATFLPFPKEHGAYFQLGLPLVAALAMRRPSASSVLFTLAAIILFLGHESLLVVVGRRGPRARRELGTVAARVSMVVVVATLAVGLEACRTSAVRLGWALWLPLGLAGTVGSLIALGIERTVLGDIVAGAALASAALPVARASGVSETDAWAVWLAWVVTAAAGTCAVRSILGARKTNRSLGRFLPVAGVVTFAAGLAMRYPWAAMAATPALALSVVLTAIAPDPRNLRRVGVALAIATTVEAVLLVAFVHR